MQALDMLKNKFELLLGWIELILKPGYDRQYRYVIERIETIESYEKIRSMIYYKLIGCRKILVESAVELNKLTLFTLFRSDHAQIIVSIATAEVLLNQTQNEISDKYKNYIEFCNLKLNGKK